MRLYESHGILALAVKDKNHISLISVFLLAYSMYALNIPCF